MRGVGDDEARKSERATRLAGDFCRANLDGFEDCARMLSDDRRTRPHRRIRGGIARSLVGESDGEPEKEWGTRSGAGCVNELMWLTLWRFGVSSVAGEIQMKPHLCGPTTVIRRNLQPLNSLQKAVETGRALRYWQRRRVIIDRRMLP